VNWWSYVILILALRLFFETHCISLFSLVCACIYVCLCNFNSHIFLVFFKTFVLLLHYVMKCITKCVIFLLQCQCRTQATVTVGISTLPRLVTTTLADDPADDLDQGQGLHPVDLPSPLTQHSDVSTDVHALTPTIASPPVEQFPNHT